MKHSCFDMNLVSLKSLIDFASLELFDLEELRKEVIFVGAIFFLALRLWNGKT